MDVEYAEDVFLRRVLGRGVIVVYVHCVASFIIQGLFAILIYLVG